MEVECARALMHARDILRTVGITGFDATANIATLLTLRELETQYPNLTDPDAFVLERAHAALKPTHNKGIVCFSALVEQVSQQAERNTSVGFAETVRDVIRLLDCNKHTHDSARMLYKSVECAFTVRDDKAACALVRHVSEKLKVTADSDALGAAYMEVVCGHAQEKELGQFFTPKALVSYLVKRASTCAETKARATGLDRSTVRALGHVLDPTCGSASFLVSAARAGATTVTGIEIDPRVSIVANFALMSAGTRAGAKANKARGSRSVSLVRIDRADFLRESPGQLKAVERGVFGYDTVLANPPFGVKTKYADIVATGDAETKLSFPISSSATGMFLQRIVRVLCVGGMGLVVLPLGNELASRQKKQTELRVALLRAVELLEIVAVPHGTFANTGIRTAALVFVKRRELQPPSGTPNEFATRKVKLVSLGDTGVRAEDFVEMAAIAAKSYSLSPDDYTTRPAEPETRAAFPIVRLGDLFTLKKGTVNMADVTAGPFLTYTSAASPTASASASEFGVGLVLAGMGTVGRAWAVSGEYGVGRECFIMKAVEPGTVDERYAAWYINTNRLDLVRQYSGTTIKARLNSGTAAAIEIPVPPVDVQAKIAAELDALERDVEKYAESAAGIERTQRALLLAVEAAPKTRLGDVCTFKAGKSITKAQLRDGPYPVVGGGVSPMGSHSEYNTEPGVPVLAKIGASCGHVGRHECRCYVTNNALSCHFSDALDQNFAFWSLWCMRPQISQTAVGVAQPILDMHKVMDLEIPVPPLDVQAKIAAELDALEETKRGLLRASELARRAMRVTLDARLGGVSGMPAGSDSDWSDMDTASI